MNLRTNAQPHSSFIWNKKVNKNGSMYFVPFVDAISLPEKMMRICTTISIFRPARSFGKRPRSLKQSVLNFLKAVKREQPQTVLH